MLYSDITKSELNLKNTQDILSDYINKIVTDDSDNVVEQSWIPTNTSNRDYIEYQEWAAIDGNTIAEAD